MFDLTHIIQTDFSNFQLVLIICAFAFGLFSVIMFLKEKHGYSLLFLFLAGLILRLIAAGLDPFLWTWDEQYHALVAKNMMSNPFRPVLISNPVLDFDFRNWQANHIWLHKQPFFLWQIALFFKIFGTTEFVLRLPGAIMMSLMIPVIYRIGKLTSTRVIAWYGAFLYTFTFFFVQITSGCICTDQNDIAFIFYIALSIWAWAEYNQTNKKYWIVLIGAFAGIAILNKWVVGLLVYSGWWLSIFFCNKKSEWLAEHKKMGISLLVTLLVAFPWQVFIFFAYPVESRYEFVYNSRHFFEAMEGHGGNSYYHLNLLADQYGGILVPFLIVPGLYLLFKSMQNKTNKVGMLTFLIGAYLFFSLAATKMVMFCMIVCPVIFLGLGAVLDYCVQKLRAYIPSGISFVILAVLLGYLAFNNLNINKIDILHSEKNPFWKQLRVDAIIDRQVSRELPSSDFVVFNCAGHNAVMWMFYSDATAYGNYPGPEQYRLLKSKGIKMATFIDQNIPGYLKRDPEVRKIFLKPFSY